MNDVDLMLRFLLQAIVILGACRLVGTLGRKFLGQTQVVMEMATGVMLGPSLLGAFFPQVQTWLFPAKLVTEGVSTKHPSMAVLYVMAQLGLVLYMFLVGLEFDARLITERAKGAISVSLAGIALPFVLGGGLALALAGNGQFDLFAKGVSPSEAALYMGAAMCITAFPMLARIIVERGMAGTSLGTLALGAGATDDAAAWSLLAIVLASYKHDIKYAIYAIGGGVLFAVVMLTVGKRFFAKLGKDGAPSSSVFAWTMLFLFTGAYVTDALGIYAVFGAFLIGAAMPRGEFALAIKERLEGAAVSIFLPFFFVYSGLNTKIGLLNSPALWGVCGLACLAAIVGKFGGCALAAKWSGSPWREAFGIGTLMNARGLMELIILNIGLQQGVITPTLFTMLTIMAIVTTLMASPIFRALYPERTGVAMPADMAPIGG